jgi:hypothetical protein
VSSLDRSSLQAVECIVDLGAGSFDLLLHFRMQIVGHLAFTKRRARLPQVLREIVAH